MEERLKKYKFEVILEQITPYIKDFKNNPNRDEVIRTTEFKPRFDKFLIYALNTNNDFDGQNFCKLLVPRNVEDDVRAFDYKVIVEKEEFTAKTKYSSTKEYDLFKTSKEKYPARSEGVKFKMTFFSLKPKMIEIIQRFLPEFLAITNFGRRKNKCYGSFYIAKEDKNYVDIDKIDFLKQFTFLKGSKNYIELNTEKIKKLLFDDETIISKLTKRRSKMRTDALITYRSKEDRKESLAIMKILKKEERYRLYVIPNFEVLNAMENKGKNYEKMSKEVCVEELDLDKFKKKVEEMIKLYKEGDRKWKK